jgi:hypothetical protein
MPIATPQGTLDFKSVDKVTFVGASSNTVIDTTTGSLGVGVGVGGPTSNLHVVGHTRLEGDINMLHTSNTASIKLNSNVVTEFPRSKKLIKYPRVAIDECSVNFYTRYRVQITANNPDPVKTAVMIGELELYGTPEYDPEAHGTDVVVKSVPNVPNTDWLEVYYDGQDYTQMPTTVTDKSGNNRTGTPSGGVGFDTEYKAFIFDGVDDYVTSTTLSSHFAGDPTVTYACWVKFNAMTTGQMFLTINAPGVYAPGVIGGLYLGTDGTIYNTVGNRGIQASEKLVTNRWYHLVATKIPGNTGTDTQKLYIDGVYVSQFPWNTSGNQVVGSNPVLRIGAAGNGNDRLNGYMANVRLFNRALTSDEIYQLYAYQKEYFGHGDLGMTLKAGRLGIGTSEPRAALDVRGDLYAPGTIVQVEQAVKTNTSAVTSTSAVDIGYLSVDITPKFSTSKILVSYIVNVGVDITGTTNMHGFLRVKRTQGGISTYIGDGASSGDRQACTSYIYNTANAMCESFSFEHLDDANGTGTVTYTIQGLVEASVYTMTINRSGSDGNNGYYGRTSSSITVKEVCQ